MKPAFPIFARSVVALCVFALCAGGCSREGTPGDDTALYQTNTATLTPGTQAVRVGDGGAAYPACVSSGVVVNLSPAGQAFLPLRAAPFAEAEEVARLNEGARLFLCTRSLDQRWQGVVVPPADAPTRDCGVTAARAAPEPYTGPCQSGWVLTAFVRPSTG